MLGYVHCAHSFTCTAMVAHSIVYFRNFLFQLRTFVECLTIYFVEYLIKMSVQILRSDYLILSVKRAKNILQNVNNI